MAFLSSVSDANNQPKFVTPTLYKALLLVSVTFEKLLQFPWHVNPLTPNDHNSGRTAPLTSKRYILYIYSTNICTEYFKHGIYSQFFLFQMHFVS